MMASKVAFVVAADFKRLLLSGCGLWPRLSVERPLFAELPWGPRDLENDLGGTRVLRARLYAE